MLDEFDQHNLKATLKKLSEFRLFPRKIYVETGR